MKRYPLFFSTIFILVLGVTTSALAFTFTTIDPPGAIATSASEINSPGQIIGIFEDASLVFHGFLRNTDGTFTTIDPPASREITLSGINNSGQIVGGFIDSSFIGHGFLRNTDDTFTIIDPPYLYIYIPTIKHKQLRTDCWTI